MKNLLIAMLISFTIVSCDNFVESPQYDQSMLVKTNNELGYIIVEIPNSDGYGFISEIEIKDRKDTTKPEKGNGPYALLFKQLNLTPDQEAVAGKLLVEHRLCVDECTAKLKEIERKILVAVKEKEAKIKADLSSGLITKAQAKEQLRALKEKANTELKKAQTESNVRVCVAECEKVFLTKLKTILTPQQIIILEKWLLEKGKRTTGGTGKDKRG